MTKHGLSVMAIAIVFTLAQISNVLAIPLAYYDSRNLNPKTSSDANSAVGRGGSHIEPRSSFGVNNIQAQGHDTPASYEDASLSGGNRLIVRSKNGDPSGDSNGDSGSPGGGATTGSNNPTGVNHPAGSRSVHIPQSPDGTTSEGAGSDHAGASNQPGSTAGEHSAPDYSRTGKQKAAAAQGIFKVPLDSNQNAFWTLNVQFGAQTESNGDKPALRLEVDTGSADIIVYSDKTTIQGSQELVKNHGYRVYEHPSGEGVAPLESGPKFRASFMDQTTAEGYLVNDKIAIGDVLVTSQWFGCAKESLDKEPDVVKSSVGPVKGPASGSSSQDAGGSSKKAKEAPKAEYPMYDGIFGLASSFTAFDPEAPATWLGQAVGNGDVARGIFTLDMIHSSYEEVHKIKSSLTFGTCLCNEPENTIAVDKRYSFMGKTSIAEQSVSEDDRRYIIDSASDALIFYPDDLKGYLDLLVNSKIKVNKRRSIGTRGKGVVDYEVHCDAKLPDMRLKLTISGVIHSFKIPGEVLVDRIFKSLDVHGKESEWCITRFSEFSVPKPQGRQSKQGPATTGGSQSIEGPKYAVLGAPFLLSVKGCFELGRFDIPATSTGGGTPPGNSRPGSSTESTSNLMADKGKNVAAEGRSDEDGDSGMHSPNPPPTRFVYCEKDIDIYTENFPAPAPAGGQGDDSESTTGGNSRGSFQSDCGLRCSLS